jgi:hypothetical protein
MMDEVLDYDDLDDCGNPTVTRYSLPRLNPPRYFESMLDNTYCLGSTSAHKSQLNTFSTVISLLDS